MKKLFASLMALMMALTSLTALAEGANLPSPSADMPLDAVILSGFVLEVQDEYLLMQVPQNGQPTAGMHVQVNLDEDTLFEGADVAVGEFVHVVYNGMMTRSLPAQITAMNVSNHKLQGIVSEMNEAGFTLTYMEDVYFVNATAQQMASIQDGMFVTIWHNGMMTSSIPAQVTADHIRGQEIVGTVTEMIEGGFILTVEGEEIPYTVYPMEDAMFFVQPEPGLEIIVITNGLMTSALDSITVNATEILPLATAAELFDMAGVVEEITDEYILITTADGQQVQVNLSAETFFEGKEIAMGDLIHVTFNGQMTRSIPAQIAALTVGCYAHQGVVSEVSEEGFILTTETDVLYVNILPGVAENLQDGRTVIVYSNGAMTMSLPAQIGAEMIVLLSR